MVHIVIAEVMRWEVLAHANMTSSFLLIRAQERERELPVLCKFGAVNHVNVSLQI